MATRLLKLSDDESRVLDEIARSAGKTSDQLLYDTVHGLIAEHRPESNDPQALLEQGYGIWKDRDDLPDIRELREGWGRRLKRLGLNP